MSYKLTPRSLSSYAALVQLRDEVRRSIKHADISRRYSRLRAARLHQLEISFVVVSSLSSVVGTIAALQEHGFLAIAALLLSLACVVAPGRLHLSERRMQHVVAHARAIDAGAAWARLTIDDYALASHQRNLTEARHASRRLASVAPRTRDVVLWDVAEKSFDHALP